MNRMNRLFCPHEQMKQAEDYRDEWRNAGILTLACIRLHYCFTILDKKDPFSVSTLTM